MQDGAAKEAGQAAAPETRRAEGKNGLSGASPVCSTYRKKREITQENVSRYRKTTHYITRAGRNMLNLSERRPQTIPRCWNSRGRMLGWICMVATSEARAASAPQIAHTRQPLPRSIVGKKREVVRRCCSPDFTWRKKEKKEKRENVEIFRHNRLFLSVMWHIKITLNNCMNRKVDAFISQ